MPLKSKAQQKWMFANKPDMADRWADETPGDMEDLPERVKPKVKKKRLKPFKIEMPK